MSISTLPTISQQDLDRVKNRASELIQFLINHYREIMAADASGQIQNDFTAEQNILKAFDVLDGQISNGGFIQLIENGYGAYIFDTPFSEYLKEWGLVKTVSLIGRARAVYELKKEILEREKSLEEFAKLYQQHPEFEPLDNEFYTIADEERNRLKDYILKHIDKFAVLA